MSFDISHLTVSFPGIGTVVDDVSLSLAPGRCLAIVGESGAGKSVLARSLLGLASEGGATASVQAEALTVAGQNMTTGQNWRALRGTKVGFILQDALGSLNPLRRIRADVGESLAIHSPGPKRERYATVNAALQQAGLDPLHATRYSWELSGGMRQRALIASAIISSPSLLIADEPTTALDRTVGMAVLDTLGELKRNGTALLLITHDLEVARRVADDVAVMDRGRIVEYGPTSQVLTAPSHPITQALLDAVPTGPKLTPAPKSSHVVLSAQGLRKTYRTQVAVESADLHLHAGEVVGIVGESGSGKSTLTRLLMGAEVADAGTVQFLDQPWVPASEKQRRARRPDIRLVPQDPLASFDPRLTVGQILTQAGGDPAPLLGAVHLPAHVASRRPQSLSGGMRQRVAIARALAGDPRVLILDEPVSALDVTVQSAILDLLREVQQERGLAMVFISHDMAVVRQMSDRVAVMSQGKIVEHGPTETLWANPGHSVTAGLLT